jgi:hypothetical protein
MSRPLSGLATRPTRKMRRIEPESRRILWRAKPTCLRRSPIAREGLFSIAARVKPRPDYLMPLPFGPKHALLIAGR